MNNRHFRIEIAESPNDDPLMLAVEASNAMALDARIGVARRSDLATAAHPNDIHAAHWRLVNAGGAWALINKKSGFAIGIGEKGVFRQIVPALSSFSERAFVNTLPLGGGAFGLRHPAKEGDVWFHANWRDPPGARTVTELAAAPWPRGQVLFTSANHGAPHGMFSSRNWRLRPASHEADPVHPPLALDAGDVSLEIARTWIGAFKGAIDSLGGSLGMFDKTQKAAAVANALGGILGFVDAGLETASLMEQEKSDVEHLYEALLPEVRGIVAGEISKAAIIDAKGEIESGKTLAHDAQAAIRGILSNNPEAVARLREAEGTPGLVTRRPALVVDDASDSFLANLLESAHTQFVRGVSKLEVRDQIESTLNPFCMAATEHVSLLFLLTSVAPSAGFGILADTLSRYDDYITRAYATIEAARLAKLQGNRDLLYQGSQSFTVKDPSAYRDHVLWTMRADFWPVFEHGASIRRMREMLL